MCVCVVPIMSALCWSLFSFMWVTGIKTQIARLGSKCLCLLSHLTSPLKKLLLSQIAFHPQELMVSLCYLFSSFQNGNSYQCPECVIKESNVKTPVIINTHYLQNWGIKGKEYSITNKCWHNKLFLKMGNNCQAW